MSTREHNSSSKPSRPISTSRRFSQVYVEIPPSPYHRSNYAPKSSRRTSEQHVRAGEERKENEPLLKDSDESMASTSSHSKTQVKRKRSERDINPTSGNDPKMKKQKLSAEGDTKHIPTTEVLANANEEYPQGFFYCHQCSKKRDAFDGLQCTVKQGKSTNSRCKARYCKTCLKNRYGEDMDAIRERGENLPPADTTEHVRDLGYSFKCPRCNEDCNCRGCRKAKGLEPTGNLTIQAKRSGVDSVATMLTGNAKLTGILPGKGKQIEHLPKKSKEPKPAKMKEAAASTVVSGEPTGKVKRAYVRKPKPLPQPLWSRVPVPASFSLENALLRIGIREFVLRFSAVMDVSRACLEELEEIGGVSTRRLHGVDEDDDNIEVWLGWISEPALKSMLLGLLGLVVESNALGKDGQKAVKAAIRDLRSAGANLNRMWAALASLQSSLEPINLSRPDTPFLSLPDPLPPPASAHIVSTRSGQLHTTGVQIVNSAQFLPVVNALVEAAMRTQVIREDIDSGAKEMKETVKAERERSKDEKERWEVVRHAGNATKMERAEHKRIINALEQAQRVALLAQAPRFARLGSDHEGRQYFALTPGAAEQDAAMALLSGNHKKSGKARGRAVVNTEDRKALKKWGWFIAVHGHRPAPDPIAVQGPKGKGKHSALEEGNSDDEGEDEDPAAERWWGFWQPEEIRKVAEWIARKNGVVEVKGRAKDTEAVDGRQTEPKDDASKGRTVSRSVSSTVADDTDIDMSTVVSSRASTPLSDVDDEDDESSELSSVSSDVEDEGEEAMYRQDAARQVIPSKVELRQLVRSLREYADVLEWRVWRMQPEENDAKEVGKNKA
ncbi:hypothetical protein DENSPDRAFT_837845 [Dentipellis sp. KUC8613]|nr:hypothetical protein DENSPDRAFT_837845 [Dentipellis sp. KUC8613]